MSFVSTRSPSKLRASPANWEEGILDVSIEPCDSQLDPLGFRAVFVLGEEKARLEKQKSFVIGASFLAKRELNLKKAGYQAPMTARAIALIESKLGQSLPMVLA